MFQIPIDASTLDANEFVSEDAYISATKNDAIMNSQYETMYETVNKLAAAIFDAPYAMLTLRGEENSWVSSKIGPEGVSKMPLKAAFWDWAVKKDHYFEVPDTSANHDVCHPCLTNTPNFRFYVGAHITSPLGEVIGTLCVFDLIPNYINSHQRALLIGLADIVANAIVVRNHINTSADNRQTA